MTNSLLWELARGWRPSPSRMDLSWHGSQPPPDPYNSLPLREPVLGWRPRPSRSHRCSGNNYSLLPAVAQRGWTVYPRGACGRQAVGQAKACPACGTCRICTVHRYPRPDSGEAAARAASPPNWPCPGDGPRATPFGTVMAIRNFGYLVEPGSHDTVWVCPNLRLKDGMSSFRPPRKHLKDGMSSFRPPSLHLKDGMSSFSHPASP